jgi:hypothetical protein
MKNLIHTAGVTLLATSAAHAQQAVQWKVSDGGNGHWYGVHTAPPDSLTWVIASEVAGARGAHLVTLTSEVEAQFVWVRIASNLSYWRSQSFFDGPFIGAKFSNGQWGWVTGEPLVIAHWGPCFPAFSDETVASYGCNAVTDRWNNLRPDNNGPICAIFEWSADCNGDGVVDYGQCRDGTLSDYDGNDIPDCCERGEACVVGSYPVQWRVEDGGNGHWYAATKVSLVWPALRDWCIARGGYLATLNSAQEFTWVMQTLPISDRFVGAYQDHADAAYFEPAGGWKWVTGEPFALMPYMAVDDCPGGSKGSCGCIGDGNQDVMIYTACCGHGLNDIGDGIVAGCDSVPRQGVMEFGADCNADGIVDYGQILRGQLVDLNSDGVPDLCQEPSCFRADLFRDFNVNGADLGILLSQWGPNTSLTVSDINSDGVVNGADLGLLLSFWGACP